MRSYVSLLPQTRDDGGVGFRDRKSRPRRRKHESAKTESCLLAGSVRRDRSFGSGGFGATSSVRGEGRAREPACSNLASIKKRDRKVGLGELKGRK